MPTPIPLHGIVCTIIACLAFSTENMSTCCTPGFLSNREAVRGFVSLIDPLVRPLDALVGERVGMKVCPCAAAHGLFCRASMAPCKLAVDSAVSCNTHAQPISVVL